MLGILISINAEAAMNTLVGTIFFTSISNLRLSVFENAATRLPLPQEGETAIVVMLQQL